jgi:hypothetical protein
MIALLSSAEVQGHDSNAANDTNSSKVDLGDAVYSHVEFLADDLLKGRDTGTTEYEIAARYVAAQFRRLGLEPAGDGSTFFQSVPLLENQIDVDSATVTIASQKGSTQLEWIEDFVMRGDSQRGEVSAAAPVVFVGWGIRAPELGHDDYDNVDVKGKIILTLTGAPSTFPHNQRAHYSSRRVKLAEAVQHGAVGWLRVQTAEDAERVPWQRLTRVAGRPGMGWINDTGNVQDFRSEIAQYALLSHPGATKLLQGSPQSLDEILGEASVGRASPFELPVRVEIRLRTSHQETSMSNVAGILRGSDDALRSEYVIYTAHLDHVGIGKPEDGDEIYNGAYDNATGVAVLLETARLFAEMPEPPRRSILFLAVGGEEKGLLGSDYYAHNPTVPIESLVANVNLDMPLFLYELADVTAFGAEHSSLDQIVEQAARAEGFKVSPDPMPEEVIFVRSDQYSFVRQGVPAVFLVPGMESASSDLNGAALTMEFIKTHYHMPSDNLERPFDLNSAARFTRANYLIGKEVANADDRPQWNEGDFFGDRFSR